MATKPKDNTMAIAGHVPDDWTEDQPLGGRWEQVAQGLASALKLADIATLAGYKNAGTVRQQLHRDEIQQRAQYLRIQLAQRHEYSRDTAMEEASQLMKKAMNEGQYGPAVAALTLKAKLAGLLHQDKEDPGAVSYVIIAPGQQASPKEWAEMVAMQHAITEAKAIEAMPSENEETDA